MSLLEGVEIGEDILRSPTFKNPQATYLRKFWTADHTQVVLLVIQGKSFAEIMELTGYTEGTVNGILRTPQAKQIKAEIAKKVFEKKIEETTQSYAVIKAKAVENIHEFVMDADGSRKKANQFGFFDRMLNVASQIDKIKSPVSEVPAQVQPTQVNNTQVNNVFMTPEAQKDLMDGLNKSLEVARVHANLQGESYGNVKSLKND